VRERERGFERALPVGGMERTFGTFLDESRTSHFEKIPTVDKKTAAPTFSSERIQNSKTQQENAARKRSKKTQNRKIKILSIVSVEEQLKTREL
jgi:hypothetical protein